MSATINIYSHYTRADIQQLSGLPLASHPRRPDNPVGPPHGHPRITRLSRIPSRLLVYLHSMHQNLTIRVRSTTFPVLSSPKLNKDHQLFYSSFVIFPLFILYGGPKRASPRRMGVILCSELENPHGFG